MRSSSMKRRSKGIPHRCNLSDAGVAGATTPAACRNSSTCRHHSFKCPQQGVHCAADCSKHAILLADPIPTKQPVCCSPARTGVVVLVAVVHVCQVAQHLQIVALLL